MNTIAEEADATHELPKGTIRIVDLETTGLDANDDVVEVAAVDLDLHTGAIIDVASRIVRPRKPIPPQASAVHHITDLDVADAPSWPDVWPSVFNAERHVVAYAAHNASFEAKWISGLLEAKPLICTYKGALRIWPDAPGHKNQILRYWLKLPVDRNRAVPAHQALPDAYVTAHLLHHLLKSASLGDLIAWSNEPALLTRVHFGIHRGSRWTDLPNDYLDWIIRKGTFDDDVMHTARMVRSNRKGPAISPAA